MFVLWYPTGIEINDPSEILARVRDFYSNLYKRCGTKTEKECLQYQYDLNLPQLSDQDRNLCEGLLTKKECWNSLNDMKNEKSPGNDGLSNEFYVCIFKVHIAPLTKFRPENPCGVKRSHTKNFQRSGLAFPYN